MHTTDRHPTDEELLLAADEELTPQRRQAVRRHLLRCAACAQRAAAFDRVAAEVADACRDALATPAGVQALSRAALRSKLETEAGQWTRSWSAAVLPPQRWLLLAAGIVLAILWTRWPGEPTPPIAGPAIVEKEALPVAALTPGATSPLTADALCAGTRSVHPVTPAMRAQVLRDYDMVDVPADQYELDYLITPELGGATDARNLWPQRYGQRTWNARVKDQLEDLLPRMVCNGELALAAAQRDMARDWILAYKKYFRTAVPLRAADTARRTTDDEPGYVLAQLDAAPALSWARGWRR
jgi:anti-sigma factor RsiW